MKHFPTSRSSGLVARLLAGALFATIVIPLGARAASVSPVHPAHGFGPVYDAAHEITLSGTIQEVVTKRTVGSPAGMHLMIVGSKGLVDAHVGPFLSKQTKAALVAGAPVRIVGANTTLHGKSYLLARQLTIGENTVTVRSTRGIMMLPHSGHSRPARPARTRTPSQTESNGGAR